MLISYKNTLYSIASQADSRFLLAVSGGIDSMVMAHLSIAANLNFGIAHCNFQLRGEASDKDEYFLLEWTKTHQIPVHVKRFDTQTYKYEQKLGTQEAARNLRYQWFEKLVEKYNYDYILTAHHANDSIETVLLNFAKGTGIRGMKGIPIQRKKFIRPLLFATKQDIVDYAVQHKIAYREDASNATDAYQRNAIRHHIIPAFEKIHPAFLQKAQNTIEYLQATAQLFHFAVATIKKEVVLEKKERTIIQMNQLMKYPAPSTLLFEWFHPLGFHSDQIQQIMECIDQAQGQFFYSKTHQALLHGDELLVEPLKKETETIAPIWINSTTELVYFGKSKITFEFLASPPQQFSSDPNIVYLDADQLQFPLEIRTWRAGDTFQPLGMEGKHKKIKAFFNDQKINRLDKEQLPLLLSNTNICWVVGYRMDERFKLTNQTRKILKVRVFEVPSS